mgnify:CR=1 FL=1
MIKRHIRYATAHQKGQIKKWRNRMTDVPAFLLGNGPSLNDYDISPLESYFTIGINRSFLKLSSNILMWQDKEFWFSEKKNIIKDRSIKVCRDTSDPLRRYFHFKLINGSFSLPQHPGVLYGTGSTGPLAVQLAHALGCNPIVLLGFDCKKRNGVTDFYGNNGHHKQHTMKNCFAGLQWIQKEITDREIISCSDNDVFERKPLPEVIKSIDTKWQKNKSYYAEMLKI